jgi:hypothetical protein
MGNSFPLFPFRRSGFRVGRRAHCHPVDIGFAMGPGKVAPGSTMKKRRWRTAMVWNLPQPTVKFGRKGNIFNAFNMTSHAESLNTAFPPSFSETETG